MTTQKSSVVIFSTIIFTMVLVIGPLDASSDPVQVKVVDSEDDSTINASRCSDVNIYIRLDDVEPYTDPDTGSTIQAIQFEFTYPSDVLEIEYTTNEEGIYVPAVEAFGVTEGSEVLEAWPVCASFVDNTPGSSLDVSLAANPVDNSFFDPSWYRSDDDIPWFPTPGDPWPVNSDRIFHLTESGKIIGIRAHVIGGEDGQCYDLKLEEIEQEVQEGEMVSLAVLNERENDPVPYKIVNGILSIRSVCDVVITNVNTECVDSSVVISWYTEDSDGNPLVTNNNAVYYGANPDNLEKGEHGDDNVDYHEITLSDLDDGIYYYEVASDCVVDDNHGELYRFGFPCLVDINDDLPAINYEFGDPSSGGNEVTAFDAFLTLQYVVGSTFSSEQQEEADVTGDGSVTALDAARMLQYTVGLIKFPKEVEIDIKPGSYPNSINFGSKGIIPVAILSSQEFDATTQVDPSTVTLAGSGVAIKGKGNTLAHQEDVNGDSLLDLVVQVETENLDPTEFQDGEAILTGQTYAGDTIEGSDEINIVPPEQATPARPASFALQQSYPNPFNPETWIPFELAEPCDVKVSIYDSRGVLIRILDLGHLDAGAYITRDKAAYWDGRDQAGEDVASGLYFYTIQAGEFTATKKMSIAR